VVSRSTKPGAGFAWRFHSGLRQLKRAYNSSRLTADKERAKLELRAAEFQKEVDAGAAPWIEDHEDWAMPYDYGDVLGEFLCQEESAILLGRVDIHRMAIADPTRWIIAL
jgi:hypothetical protein